MTAVTTVVAGPAHAAVLAALHGRCFDDGWDEKAFADILAMPGASARIALADDGEPEGFLILTTAADEAEVVTVGVVPTARRGGRASALLGDALDEAAAAGAARIFLEVAEDNTSARAFYVAHGFSQAGRRKGYYKRPGGRMDALILSKVLTPIVT